MPPETVTTAVVQPVDVVLKKPKPRKGKAKRPAADAPPRKPRVTLRSRIEAMGPTHLAAYRILCDGSEYDAALRAAFRADEESVAAHEAVARATHALDDAEQRVTDTDRACAAARAVLAKLDRLARDIATARGDVPHADDAPVAEPATV